MNENVADIIKANKIFSALDEEGYARIASKFSQISLNHGEVLFYQGDPSDSVYLLVSGKLSAELTTASGETRIIGHIDVGETVGELGALSNDSRSLTIKALKDSQLLKLPEKYFIEICHRYPAVMFATLHPIIMRSKNLMQVLSSEKVNKHVVIIPANNAISLAEFAGKLIALASGIHGILLVSDYQAEFSDYNATIESVKEKIKQMAQDKKSSHRTIYILKSHDTPLARIGFKKADGIYIAAHSHSEARIDHHILDKLAAKHLRARSDPNLILIHPEGTLIPENTTTWLSLTNFGMHHHVRMDTTKDFQRLLRFIRGKAVGVVLSGGGTRGWAHLGVIKALRAAKIPIDMIGGVSVGAIVAACYATQLSYNDAYEKFYKVVVGSNRSVSWRSLTWPAISLFDAKYFTQAQKDAFGQMSIEDLWIPYFCVSCNLASNSEVVHRTGLLWEKVRASTAIPGLIPPMLINGEIHFDGGVLNNLPVDVMRAILGNKAKIIAVELNTFAPQHRKYHFPPILTFKETLFAKLGFGRNKYKFPRFVDTFLRGLFVGALAKAKQNSLGANIFVSLDLSKYRILQSNPEEAPSLIEIGYTEAIKQIYQAKGESGSVTEISS